MQNTFRKGGQTFSRGIAHQAKPSAIYLDASILNHPIVTTTPRNLPADQQRILDSAIRVDQAGEVAANWIYKGQLFVLGRNVVTGPLIQVCSFGQLFNLPSEIDSGHVGPRKETFTGNGEIADPT